MHSNVGKLSAVGTAFAEGLCVLKATRPSLEAERPSQAWNCMGLALGPVWSSHDEVLP